MYNQKQHHKFKFTVNIYTSQLCTSQKTLCSGDGGKNQLFGVITEQLFMIKCMYKNKGKNSFTYFKSL